MTDLAEQLSEPIPKEQRKSFKGAGGRTMTYITARTLMDRLDNVCGVDGWQSRFHSCEGRVICELSILFGDVWITKSDGAGDSDIEPEKGGISGAFKRAGVMFGVARELYPDSEAAMAPREQPKPGASRTPVGSGYGDEGPEWLGEVIGFGMHRETPWGDAPSSYLMWMRDDMTTSKEQYRATDDERRRRAAEVLDMRASLQDEEPPAGEGDPF